MASYTKLNVQTVSDMLSQNSNAQVTAWVMRALQLGKASCVFYDNFIGGTGSGKPIIEMSDMNVKAGNTLVVPTLARLGGPGVQGNGERTGQEEKMRQGSFTTKTGRHWWGTALDSVAKNETVIGTQWDLLRNEALGQLCNKEKSDTIQMELINNASGLNTIYANNVGSVENLRSKDYFLTDTVSEGQEVLATNAAKGMNIRKSTAGAPYRCFTYYLPHLGASAMKRTTKYKDLIQFASERGDLNPGFTGDFAMIDGCGIYSDEVEDHDAYGPVGSPCLPRARLGVAIAAGTGTFDIQGGGSAEGAALTAPLYFRWFNNSLWSSFNVTRRQASTSTTRYVLIKNVTGSDAGKFGMYSYTTNNGNKLTIVNRLGSAASSARVTTLGNVTWNTGVWNGLHTDVHPVGSIVMECNSYGQTFCYGFGLGEMAAVAGHANIDGTLGIGIRTEEHRNHNMDHAIGLETAWGCAVTQRTDGLANNYILTVSAYNPPGLPNIV